MSRTHMDLSRWIWIYPNDGSSAARRTVQWRKQPGCVLHHANLTCMNRKNNYPPSHATVGVARCDSFLLFRLPFAPPNEGNHGSAATSGHHCLL
jgi:hypothetical protein